MLAAVGDTGYNAVLLLHIVLVILAFAPVIAHPLMAKQTETLDPSARKQVLGFIAGNSQKVYANLVIAAGVVGFGLVGMSDSVYALSDGWVVASIVAWVAIVGVLHGVMVPAEKRLADGDPAAESTVALGGAVLTVLMLVTLFLMVFKPGN